MKRLCLFRHAKSTYGALGTDDFERPLHEIGQTNAPIMANVLKKNYKFKPDLILSSPALRAKTTTNLLCEGLGYQQDKIEIEKNLYEAGVEDLLSIISAVDSNVENLLIVGHNPGLTLLANFLADEHVANLHTCGVFAIEFETDSWDDLSTVNSKVLFIDEPNNHQ